MENSIEVKNVEKSFKVYLDKSSNIKEFVIHRNRRRTELRQVLKGISFTVKEGEAVALIGRNGCGKSTTLKMLTKIMYPDKGTIEMRGRVSSLIELGAGFHPDMSGRENIYINASIFGLSKKEIDRRVKDIIEFSELEEFIDNPVRTYSSGMYMRLAFSVAINVDADILLIDEILTVGDAGFQTKCYDRLKEIKKRGVTIVLVSHDGGAIKKLCDRAIWIEKGRILEEGNAETVVDNYSALMMQEAAEKKKREEDRERAEKAEQAENAGLNEHGRPIIDASQNHFGTGEVVITDCKILDKDGKETKLLYNGGDYTIEFSFENRKKIETYVFGTGFNDLDGKCLMGNNTVIDGMHFTSIEDKGVARCHIKNLPLLEGEYGLNASVVDEYDTPVDFYRNYMTFRVVSKDHSSGYFGVEHSWEVEGAK